MVDVKQERVVTQEVSPVNGVGGETVSTSREERSVPGVVKVKNAVWLIAGIIIALLAARFVLRLTGANPGNTFTSIVYAVSGFFSMPFDTMFGAEAIPASGAVQSVFEPSILVAIAVYAVVAWGIGKALTVGRPKQPSDAGL